MLCVPVIDIFEKGFWEHDQSIDEHLEQRDENRESEHDDIDNKV